MLERLLDIEVGEHGGGNRGDRANLHHDGFQAQVLDPSHRKGILPLRRTRPELGKGTRLPA